MVYFQCEEVVDPVTGASYLRPRQRLQSTVKPPTASEDHDSPGPPVIPFPPAFANTQQEAFRRWLQSFPHWRLPRSPFPGWIPEPPSDPFPFEHHPPNFAFEGPEEAYFGREPPTPHPQYAPLRMPGSRIDFLRNRDRYPHDAYARNETSDMIPNRVPDLVEWDNVNGGTLHWTPHPWQAHPLPHPSIPGQTFWASAAPDRWQGPGGLPANAVDPRIFTGGHPLPGYDPRWTPSGWPTPLPSQYSPHRIIVSPFLALNSRASVTPHVLWDASIQPPNTIRRLTARGDIVDLSGTESMNQAATWPNTKKLLINLPYMHSSWGPVTITKKDNTFVTVKDVFDAVSKYLHTRLTQAEYNVACSMHARRKEEISYAFHRRCWASPHLYQSIYMDGVKRVDLLDSPVFLGVWPNYSNTQPDTIALEMGFVPRHALPQY